MDERTIVNIVTTVLGLIISITLLHINRFLSPLGLLVGSSCFCLYDMKKRKNYQLLWPLVIIPDVIFLIICCWLAYTHS